MQSAQTFNPVPKPTKADRPKKKAKPKKINKSKVKGLIDSFVSKTVRLRGVCEGDQCFNKDYQTNRKALVMATFEEIEGFDYKFWRKNKGLLQWAHIIPRGYHSTRWDEDNAFCLCSSCHMYYTYHPIEWEEFVIRKIGKIKYQELKFRAKQLPPKWDLSELLEQKRARYYELLGNQEEVPDEVVD